MNFDMILGHYPFTDEILGHFTSFPHEEKVVQLSSLDHAKHIHSSLHHGKCKTVIPGINKWILKVES